MSPEHLFSMLNGVALIGWLALALAPWAQRPARIIARVAIPGMLAVTYSLLIATSWPGAPGGFSSLAGVALLFSNPWLLLAGWTHYLAFDLLVGCWEVADARSRGLAHAFVLPCLAVTFLFGPAGWLLYLAIRTACRNPPLPAQGSR